MTEFPELFVGSVADGANFQLANALYFAVFCISFLLLFDYTIIASLRCMLLAVDVFKI
jgi:hypothetical protein